MIIANSLTPKRKLFLPLPLAGLHDTLSTSLSNMGMV